MGPLLQRQVRFFAASYDGAIHISDSRNARSDYSRRRTSEIAMRLIRNSWGPRWGEDGFIRLLRHKDGERYCGVDRHPEVGVGCKGGPRTLPVCGMCGILSDSAYPTGVEIAKVV